MAAAAESSPGASRAGDSTTAEAPRRGAASTSGEGWSAAEEVAEAEEAAAEAEDPTRGASACPTDPSPAWFATRRR